MNLEKVSFTIIITILILMIAVLVVFNIIATENKGGFTELYFTDDLPKTIKINEEYYFSFAIHNLENQEMGYDYSVYLQSDKISQGHLTLKHDETTVISQSFTVNKTETGSMPISVQLLNKGQEIHFWVGVK